MKFPKTLRRYCPSCRKHTEMSIKREKVGGKRRSMAQGQRRFKRTMKGFGSFPRPNPKDRQKPTRKVDLRYKCKECKKEFVIGKGFRVKKLEFTKKGE